MGREDLLISDYFEYVKFCFESKKAYELYYLGLLTQMISGCFILLMSSQSHVGQWLFEGLWWQDGAFLWMLMKVDRFLFGDSGRVVNSLDFCPASLKSLGCFYFLCVLSSQWKAVTENLRILHCQL